MSAEKYAKSALRKVTACHAAGQFFAGLGAVLHNIGKTSEGFAQTCFINECDAARRYNAATGYDLGAAQGFPLRYSDDLEELQAGEPGEDDLEL